MIYNISLRSTEFNAQQILMKIPYLALTALGLTSLAQAATIPGSCSTPGSCGDLVPTFQEINVKTDLNLIDADGSNYMGIKSPAVVTADTVLTLPDGAGANGEILTTDGSGNLSWSAIASGLWTGSGSDVYFNTGNVGIGTTTPGAPLEVSRTESTAGNIYEVARFSVKEGAADRALKILVPTGGLSEIGFGKTTGSSWVFKSQADANLLTITDAGNVGIGTTAPAYKLEVDGVIRSGDNTNATQGMTMMSGKYTTGHATSTLGTRYGSGALVLGYASEPDKGTSGQDSAYGINSVGRSFIEVGSDIKMSVAPSQTTAAGTAISNFEQALTIQGATGNVGIGTTAPTNNLHVAGSVRVGTGGSYEDIILESSTDGFSNGGLTIRPATIPGTGIANFYTHFKTPGTVGTTNHNVVIDGNVGIGTTAPAVALDVNDGVVNASAICDENNANCIDLSAGVSSGGKFVDGTTAADAVFTGGNVGIGIADPATLLDVNGQTRLRGTTFLGAPTATKGILTFSNDIGGGEGGIIVQGDTGNGVLVRGDAGSTAGMIIKGSGNVGIGTPSPSSLFHVKSAVPSNVIYIEDDDKTWIQGIESGAPNSYSIWEDTPAGTNNRLQLHSGGDVTMGVGVGNVGVGTVTPGDKFAVVGNSRITGTLFADTIAHNNNTGGNVHIDAGDTGGTDHIYLNFFNGDGVYFGNGATSATGVWQSGGNVGIGTLTPFHDLSVVAATGSSTGGIGVVSAAGDALVKLRSTAADRGVLELTDESGTDVVDLRAYADSAVLTMDNAAGDQKVYISSAGDSHFMAGNVGIGTTTPEAVLEISGSESPSIIFDDDQGSTQRWEIGEGISTNNGELSFKELADDSQGSNVVFDITGNVGIGTTSPDNKLSIVGGTDVGLAGGGFLTLGEESAANISIDTNEIMARDNGVGAKIYIQNDTGSGDTIFNSNSGSVGVGTAVPKAKFHVEGPVILGAGSTGTNAGGGRRNLGIASYFSVANNSTDYVHIKTSINPTVVNDMFHFKVTGYAYGSSEIVDLTYVGYAYASGGGNITNTKTLDPTGLLNPVIYKGSDNLVYLRFKPSSVYHLTFTVDTMQVGNGPLFEEGDLEIIQSATANL